MQGHRAAGALAMECGGVYRWLPRPPATPSDRTPYAPMPTETRDAVSGEVTKSSRLVEPPPVGDCVGCVVFSAVAAADETVEVQARDAKHCGVILVGEWWGIDTHVLKLGRSLACAGFDVLCLDVFRDGPGAIPVDLTRGYDTPVGLQCTFQESAHKMKTCNCTTVFGKYSGFCHPIRLLCFL